jgi:hypothetical protein
MTELFDITLRHENGDRKFVNCSIDNAINIIQQDLYMRNISVQLTIPLFWDIVYSNDNNDLYELINDCKIVVKNSNICDYTEEICGFF